MFSKSLFAISSVLAFVAAAPSLELMPRGALTSAACSNPVAGLTTASCQYMAKLGFAAQGANAHANNGKAWIGTDGPNVFEMHNNANVPVTVVLWTSAAGSYTAMCVNVSPAAITASIDPGKSVSVSIANGVSGAFSGLYNGQTTLANFGGINNVWGEFTTGAYATVDVSREPNMSGNHMSIKVAKGNQAGCVSEYTATGSKCAFQCNGNVPSCTTGYSIVNCDPKTNPGAQTGTYGGAASGGCSGWNNGGHIDVSFL